MAMKYPKLKQLLLMLIVDILIISICQLIISLLYESHQKGLTLLSSLLWILIGIASGKLLYNHYTKSSAIITIIVVNLLSSISIIGILTLIYGKLSVYPELILLFSTISFLEILFYTLLIAYKRFEIPYIESDEELFEYNRSNPNFPKPSENKDGIEEKTSGIFNTIRHFPIKNRAEWVNIHGDDFGKKVKIMQVNSNDQIHLLCPNQYDLFFNLAQLNKVRRVNKLFMEINSILPNNGIFICCFQTSSIRRKQIQAAYPFLVRHIVSVTDFVWNRVFPKLPAIRKIYFGITKGMTRVFPRPEILGRLYSCGFEVKQELPINGLLYIVSIKVKQPIKRFSSSYGMFIKLKRVGKDGKIIGVYKFRTMFAYSEYLQQYIYEKNHLSEGGKFANDFRISPLGKIMRKFWIDELPMIINLIKGDIKLVGVRPISEQFFSLYSKDMQELRIKTKPGLLPPFYYDLPKTFHEIEESERRYCELYLQNPGKTDWKYLWKILYNIIIKNARSK